MDKHFPAIPGKPFETFWWRIFISVKNYIDFIERGQRIDEGMTVLRQKRFHVRHVELEANCQVIVHGTPINY